MGSESLISGFDQAILDQVHNSVSVAMVNWIIDVEKQLLGLQKRVRVLERSLNTEDKVTPADGQ